MQVPYISSRGFLRQGVLTAFALGLTICCGASGTPREVYAAETTKSELATSSAVSRRVDELLDQELQASGVTIAGSANDEDFLRRVSFDITGTPPTPRDVTLFGLNPDPLKRERMIESLLASPGYGQNWANYWRDVVFMSATNTRGRGAASVFEAWIADQLNQNRPWDQIVTEMLTATGNVGENGATGLLFAHSAQAEEVAAEACRIFLGIQIQCANCHDHPSDIWKREQFHELAAYFPRMAVRPIVVDGQQRGFEVVSVNLNRRAPTDFLKENPQRLFAMLDRNRDSKLTKAELADNPRTQQLAQLFDRILENGDSNKDQAISLEELRKLEFPGMPGRGSTEYYMPDLKDPASRGTIIQPRFFVDESRPGEGLSDSQRRSALASSMTSADNPWFARAVINRLWNELLGEGFYMPVDDLGPTRSPAFPQVLDALSEGFIAQGYDLKWLVQTITNTQAYQRQVRPRPVSSDSLPFAAQTPTRLRSDQLYSALNAILGLERSAPARPGGMGGGLYMGDRSLRGQFNPIFGFDPSTPQADITGNVQQALLLMNAQFLRGSLSATGNSRLSLILRQHPDNQDATAELYLLTLSREPSDEEQRMVQSYVAEVGDRNEAFEDLLWSLLNSSEFLSRR